MAADPRDFPGEGKEYNKCHRCKYFFTGTKGRVYCLLCAPTTITEDQILVVDSPLQ
jgi:hypothetical protein